MSSIPFAERVLDAVVASLRLADGTGDYNNDLTGAGAVAIEERFHGPAQVIVFVPDIGRDPSARLLRRVDRTVTVYCQGKVSGAGVYEDRLRAALRLGSDCVRAIETNLRAQLNAIEAGLYDAVHREELSFSTTSGLPQGDLGAFVIALVVTYKLHNAGGF